MNQRIFADVKVQVCTEDIPKTNVIYCLTFPNNKIYIGQTRNVLETRIKQHCFDSFNPNRVDFNSKKGRAVRKYMTFTVSILYEGENLDE